MIVIFFYTGIRDMETNRHLLAVAELWLSGFLSYDLADEIWRLR